MLSYALSTNPNPLQAGMPAWLTLAVSNDKHVEVLCNRIEVTLPVGTLADDLIATDTIAATPPPGWTITRDGGSILFDPPGGSIEIRGAGLVLGLAILVNDQPGVTRLQIVETVSGVQSSMTMPVAKFPADFSLGPLSALPEGTVSVGYGEPAQLMWTTTGANVACTLAYQPAEDGQPVTTAVPATGPVATQPICRTSVIVFTLTAQVSVPGQDDPLTAQQQLSLQVDALSLTFTAEPSSVGVNGLARVAWDAPGADACVLDLGPPLPPSGARYFVLDSSRQFSMVATGPNGQSATAQCTVKVDPTIVPTGTFVSFIAEAGDPGADGAPGGGGGDWMGSAGGTGMDGNLGWIASSLPPLDTTGRSNVLLVQVAGGAGGIGGAGGACACPTMVLSPSLTWTWAYCYASGGNGGNGGDAVANLAFGVEGTTGLPPAQFILSITGGAGGAGGAGGYADPGYTGPMVPGQIPGAPGASGAASLTVQGSVVSLP